MKFLSLEKNPSIGAHRLLSLPLVLPGMHCNLAGGKTGALQPSLLCGWLFCLPWVLHCCQFLRQKTIMWPRLASNLKSSCLSLLVLPRRHVDGTCCMVAFWRNAALARSRMQDCPPATHVLVQVQGLPGLPRESKVSLGLASKVQRKTWVPLSDWTLTWCM